MSFSAPSFPRQFFSVAAAVLWLDRGDVQKTMSAQKIDTKSLELCFLKLIVDYPKYLVHRQRPLRE
jgi:hypothetical protein